MVLGTAASAPARPRLLWSRRSRPRSSRRCSSARSGLAVERYGLQPRRRSPQWFDLAAIKKQGLSALLIEFRVLTLRAGLGPNQAAWTSFAELCGSCLSGAPEGIFLPRLRPRCLFVGAGDRIGQPSRLLRATLPKLRGRLSPICAALRPNFSHESRAWAPNRFRLRSHLTARCRRRPALVFCAAAPIDCGRSLCRLSLKGSGCASPATSCRSCARRRKRRRSSRTG